MYWCISQHRPWGRESPVGISRSVHQHRFFFFRNLLAAVRLLGNVNALHDPRPAALLSSLPFYRVLASREGRSFVRFPQRGELPHSCFCREGVQHPSPAESGTSRCPAAAHWCGLGGSIACPGPLTAAQNYVFSCFPPRRTRRMIPGGRRRRPRRREWWQRRGAGGRRDPAASREVANGGGGGEPGGSQWGSGEPGGGQWESGIAGRGRGAAALPSPRRPRPPPPPTCPALCRGPFRFPFAAPRPWRPGSASWPRGTRRRTRRPSGGTTPPGRKRTRRRRRRRMAASPRERRRQAGRSRRMQRSSRCRAGRRAAGRPRWVPGVPPGRERGGEKPSEGWGEAPSRLDPRPGWLPAVLPRPRGRPAGCAVALSVPWELPGSSGLPRILRHGCARVDLPRPPVPWAVSVSGRPLSSTLIYCRELEQLKILTESQRFFCPSGDPEHTGLSSSWWSRSSKRGGSLRPLQRWALGVAKAEVCCAFMTP